jgi:hypothetical protein
MFRLASVLVLSLCTTPVIAQPQLLQTDGYGSLSGKVTLAEGIAIPVPDDLVPKMKMHIDRKCCLDPKAKPNEKIDLSWVVDKDTRGIANVVVWIKPPAKTYLETHVNYQKRKDDVIIDQPHCAYVPRVSASNPVYFDGKGEVPTGQKLIFKNSAVVPHNVQGIVDMKVNEGFNPNMPPKSELDFTKKIKPQRLPVLLNCNIHPWMRAELYVFDHPYYAITNAKGEYTIPFVPAGAEVFIMGHLADAGYLLNNNKGHAITIENGKKHTFDFSVKK